MKKDKISMKKQKKIITKEDVAKVLRGYLRENVIAITTEVENSAFQIRYPGQKAYQIKIEEVV